jgi:toxin-antitoxin system PIN domain toxin
VSVTVDANVLVYASNTADPAHEGARQLIGRLGTGPDIVYLFWPTILGYLRIVTHPAILPRPLTPARACANVDRLLARSHVRTGSEGDGFWRRYRDVGGGQARGNSVPDTQLVALMRQEGVRVIYTRDRAFRRFDGIEVRDFLAEGATKTPASES